MLEKEYTFWLNNRASTYTNETTGEEMFLYFQYRAAMKFPRPESYREDMELVHGLENESTYSQVSLMPHHNCSGPIAQLDSAERERMWSNVASAAETGWDFR